MGRRSCESYCQQQDPVMVYRHTRPLPQRAWRCRAEDPYNSSGSGDPSSVAQRPAQTDDETQVADLHSIIYFNQVRSSRMHISQLSEFNY